MLLDIVFVVIQVLLNSPGKVLRDGRTYADKGCRNCPQAGDECNSKIPCRILHRIRTEDIYKAALYGCQVATNILNLSINPKLFKGFLPAYRKLFFDLLCKIFDFPKFGSHLIADLYFFVHTSGTAAASPGIVFL